MAASSNLTIEALHEATGAAELSKLREAEIIFSHVQSLGGGGLDKCTSLTSLTLIDTGLQSPLIRGPELSSVSETLARLCITEQKGLKSLGPLRLPALRDLLLHSNGLESLEGLDGCPRLQRLWVWGNKLQSLTGLHAQADLRELWAQDNRLERVSGVEHLVSLQVLDVAGNPVSNLKDVQKLAHLPRLRSVSFADPHFGPCPVVAASGYRQFVLLSMPRLTHLDGQTVGDADREGADEAFLRQAEEFEAARAESDAAFHVVLQRLGRRAASVVDAEREAEAELATMVEGLEGTVRRGREAVRSEGERVRRVQEEARQEASRSMGALRRLQEAWVARARAAVERRREREEALLGWCDVEDACRGQVWRALEQAAGGREAGGASSSPRLPLTVAALPPHAPDFKALAVAAGRCGEGAAQVVQCGRCHSSFAEEALEAVEAAEAAGRGQGAVALSPWPSAGAALGAAVGSSDGVPAGRLVWSRQAARLPGEGWLIGSAQALVQVLGAGGALGGDRGVKEAESGGDSDSYSDAELDGSAGAASTRSAQAGESPGGAIFAPDLPTAVSAAVKGGLGVGLGSSGGATAVGLCVCRCEVVGLLEMLKSPSASCPVLAASADVGALGAAGQGGSSAVDALARLLSASRADERTGPAGAALVTSEGRPWAIAFPPPAVGSAAAQRFHLLFAPDAVAAMAARPGEEALPVPAFAGVRSEAEKLVMTPPSLPPATGETEDGEDFVGMFGEAELLVARATCTAGGPLDTERVCQEVEEAAAAVRRDYAVAVLHGVTAPLAQQIGKSRGRAARSRADVARAQAAVASERVLQQRLAVALGIERASIESRSPALEAPVGMSQAWGGRQAEGRGEGAGGRSKANGITGTRSARTGGR